MHRADISRGQRHAPTERGADSAIDLSIIVAVFEEEGNIEALVREIHTALAESSLEYEILCVDDGSRDRSFELLANLAREDPRLIVIRFRRNFGQSAAMQAGLDHATGDAIAFIDGDLQNDPADIPMMYERLGAEYDLVAGWRFDRKDSFTRRLPSVMANRLISATTKVRLHDYGCSLKLLRADLAKELRLYGEMHRFIPVLCDWIGARVIEVKVNHRAREHGTSKYGIGRTTRVVLDLILVRFLQRYQAKPMQVFGFVGLLFGFIGAVICGYLAIQKFMFGMNLADRPLLLMGVLLVVVGVQLVSTGLVADILGRTYFEAQGKPPYHVREILRASDEASGRTRPARIAGPPPVAKTRSGDEQGSSSA